MGSLRRNVEEMGFSGLLFDTLFGLILFFNIDSILEINNTFHLIFYVFTILIVVHWWLIFKSADDTYGNEVRNSIVDVVFGLVYIFFIMLVVLHTKKFNLFYTTLFLTLLFLVDIVWSVTWKHGGKWKVKDKAKIRIMENDLKTNIKLDVTFFILFMILCFASSMIDQVILIFLIIVTYVAYIYATIKTKIISFNYF